MCAPLGGRFRGIRVPDLLLTYMNHDTPRLQMILSCTRSEALGRNLLQEGRGLIG